MTNPNKVLATLVLFFLLVSRQEPLLVTAHRDYDEIRSMQQQQVLQYNSHHARHHHHHQHQPHQQHQDHHHTSSEVASKFEATKKGHKLQEQNQHQSQSQNQQWMHKHPEVAPKANHTPSSTSKPTSTTAVRAPPHKGHHQHSQSTTAKPVVEQTSFSVTPSQPHNHVSRQPKSLSDVILQHTLKTSHNRLEHANWKSSSSVDDYADDYYYDVAYDSLDDDEDADEADEVSEAAERRLSAKRTSAQEYVPRVTRDHNRLHGLHYDQTIDQDYADDEPYRSSAEQFQGDAAGVLTDQKYRELGTMEAVQQTRDKYLQEQEQLRPKTPAEMAREHMNRMKVATKCSRPLPRVIHVSNETSKRYVPYCTILHRCGEDTGCCDSTRQVCTVKSYADVEVYFFVIKVNSGTNRRDTEVLMLRNHTECHCVDRSNYTSTSYGYMPRDKRSGLSLLRPNSATDAEQQPEEEFVDEANTICRCPRHFDVFQDDFEQQSGEQRHYFQPHSVNNFNCRCDCLSNNLPCQRLKDGEEGFSVDERKCIAERNCNAPTCSHGDYSRQTGRCPRLRNHKRNLKRRDYGFG